MTGMCQLPQAVLMTTRDKVGRTKASSVPGMSRATFGR